MDRLIEPLMAIIVSAVLLPLIYLIYWKFSFHSGKKFLFHLLFSFYFVAMASLVGFPEITSLTFDLDLNYIPFVKMFDSNSAVLFTLLNVLLFIPLGMFLPLLCEECEKFWHTLAFAFLTSLSIEFMQIFTFRVTDIDDIITNVFGTIIGYILMRIFSKGFSRFTVKWGMRSEVLLSYVTIFLYVFFVLPLFRLLISMGF